MKVLKSSVFGFASTGRGDGFGENLAADDQV